MSTSRQSSFWQEERPKAAFWDEAEPKGQAQRVEHVWVHDGGQVCRVFFPRQNVEQKDFVLHDCRTHHDNAEPLDKKSFRST